MTVFNALSYNNEAFRVYITYGGLLLLKLLLMAFVTIFQRIRKGAVENPEDAAGRENFEIKKDEDVERVRRAHLNDLENIPPFLLAALMYIMSEPHVVVASWLIRVAVLSRFLHTFAYVFVPIGPARAIGFFTTLLITIFMIVWSMVVFFHF